MNRIAGHGFLEGAKCRIMATVFGENFPQHEPGSGQRGIASQGFLCPGLCLIGPMLRQQGNGEVGQCCRSLRIQFDGLPEQGFGRGRVPTAQYIQSLEEQSPRPFQIVGH